jgi:hypothetical protein
MSSINGDSSSDNFRKNFQYSKNQAISHLNDINDKLKLNKAPFNPEQ